MVLQRVKYHEKYLRTGSEGLGVEGERKRGKNERRRWGESRGEIRGEGAVRVARPEASEEGEEAGEGSGATEGGRGSKKREQKDRKYSIIH